MQKLTECRPDAAGSGLFFCALQLNHSLYNIKLCFHMMTVILIFLVGSGVNGVGSETIIFFFCLLVPVYF